MVQWFWRRFLKFVTFFIFILSPFWKGCDPSFEEHKSPSPRYTQVLFKLAQWFWKRRFLYFVNTFFLFCYYLPLEKGWSFIWTNLNYQECFVPSLVEIGPMVLKKKIFKLHNNNNYTLFRNNLPLEKSMAHHLNKMKPSSPRDDLCQVWCQVGLKLAERFWRRIWKCEKYTCRCTDRQTDRQTGNVWQAIRKAHFYVS